LLLIDWKLTGSSRNVVRIDIDGDELGNGGVEKSPVDKESNKEDANG